MQNMESNKLISCNEIAEKFSIPKELLAKSLQKLARLEIINAFKGPKGGYSINESINNLSFMEFIEILEGPQGLVRCTTESDCCLLNVCNIREPINIINNNIKTMFSNISLREITQ